MSRAALLGCLLALPFLVSARCGPPKQPFVSLLVLLSSTPISDTETEYVFEVVLHNPLEEIEEVVAIAAPLAGANTTVLDGESRVDEPIPARTSLTSKDTITVLHMGDKSDPAYTGADLAWQVSYRLVGPPPNHAPLAGAQFPQTVLVGDVVALDGRSSGDPDGDPLSYLWSFASAPAGSTAQLLPFDADQTSFVPDLPGLYHAQLVVNDGLLSSLPATVPITVLPIDPGPPSVVSRHPEPDATLVPVNTSISAQFSEWIDPATVDATTFRLVGPEGVVPARSVRASGAVAIFEPAAPLRSNGTYRATLAAPISDRQGQRLDTDVEWTFSTSFELDLDPPQIASVTPADGTQAVIPTVPGTIQVEFTDTIDATSLVGRLTVAVAGGAAVPGHVELDSGYRARFVLDLAPGQGTEDQTWVVTVAPGVVDTSGNALASALTWSFTTMPSHAPAWLSRPGGLGSPTDTYLYYQGLPIATRCAWNRNNWTWECAGTGAPPLFTDWLWDLGWRRIFDLDESSFYEPIGEPRAVFYDTGDLAVARNARCFIAGPPDDVPGGPHLDPSLGAEDHPFDSANGSGDDYQVGCYVSNHGPAHGAPDHPDVSGALSDAQAEAGATSVSAIFSRYDDPRDESVEGVEERDRKRKSFSLQQGDVVTVGPATGSIWAGDLLYGSNGPNGIEGRICTGGCPLDGAPLYGLLVETPQVRLASGALASGRRALGTSTLTFKVLERGPLVLWINDQVGGNGSGRFDVPVVVTRANAVSFQVYVPDSTGRLQLATSATFDREGAKPVPQACIACHGGTWDPETRTVTGASLLPFEPGRFVYPNVPAFTRAAQEGILSRLNTMVRKTQENRASPASSIREWVEGTYQVDSRGIARSPADDTFVPPGWSADASLYHEIAKPFCLSCHRALSGGLDFDTAAEFRGLGAAIQQDVCVQRSMPHAGPAFEAFWQTGAAQQLAQSLFGGADCGP